MTRKLTVTLETVTPLFLAGADKEKPELRPPSVRGQLRYWLRAALGVVVGDDLDALKTAESEVFGSTEGTGAVTVRTSHPNLSVDKFNPLPHKKMSPFNGIVANQKFEVYLTQHSQNEETWLAALSALLLMVSFGGLGRRCRRGWGSLRIVKSNLTQAGLTDVWHEVFTSHSPDSPERWLDYLQISLKLPQTQYGIYPLLKGLGAKRKQAGLPTPYTIAAPKVVAPIVVKNIYPDPIEAIRDFGQREHNFRASNAFGSATPRQGSPLWVRVFPILMPQRGYVLTISFFDTEFDNRNEKRIGEFLRQWNNVKMEALQ